MHGKRDGEKERTGEGDRKRKNEQTWKQDTTETHWNSETTTLTTHIIEDTSKMLGINLGFGLYADAERIQLNSIE